jgi:hypothetical protein
VGDGTHTLSLSMPDNLTTVSWGESVNQTTSLQQEKNKQRRNYLTRMPRLQRLEWVMSAGMQTRGVKPPRTILGQARRAVQWDWLSLSLSCLGARFHTSDSAAPEICG